MALWIPVCLIYNEQNHRTVDFNDRLFPTPKPVTLYPDLDPVWSPFRMFNQNRWSFVSNGFNERYAC